MQVLSSYISQAIVYQFTYFATSDSNFILTLLFQVVVALVSGILLGAFSFGKIIKGANDKVSKMAYFSCFFRLLNP
ncbi:hypothetical protein [Streptococcus gallolyticus]|uniref:hypothetical protein n=1 Tax=Streptococcus gallolyticus TaxID=315405 RepID=UPI000A93F6CD|nr:hypothetical protein [Streptococcus gallolyticus]